MAESISKEILQDLYARFILNLPRTNNSSEYNVRIFFEIEYAHWFYLDNYCNSKNQVYLNMFDFTALLFDKFPDILPRHVDWRLEYDEWKRYKACTPTSGAIILDENLDMILLVKGFFNNRWSFPGGKLNESESYDACAIREIEEEVGIDIRPFIKKDIFIEFTRDNTPRRQYIIEGLSLSTPLRPNTKNEIEAITWFHINDLPVEKSDKQALEKLKMRSQDFFVILPYVKQIKSFIHYRKLGYSQADALNESKSTVNNRRPRSRLNSEKSRVDAGNQPVSDRDTNRPRQPGAKPSTPKHRNSPKSGAPSGTTSPANNANQGKVRKGRGKSRNYRPSPNSNYKTPGSVTPTSGQALLAVIQGRQPPQFVNKSEDQPAPDTHQPPSPRIPEVFHSLSRSSSHSDSQSIDLFLSSAASFLTFEDDDNDANRNQFFVKSWANVHIKRSALLDAFMSF